MNHWMTSPYEWLLTMSIDHSSCKSREMSSGTPESDAPRRAMSPHKVVRADQQPQGPSGGHLVQPWESAGFLGHSARDIIGLV